MKKFLAILTMALVLVLACSVAFAEEIQTDPDSDWDVDWIALEYASRLHRINKDEIEVVIEEVVKPTTTQNGIIRFQCVTDTEDDVPHFHEIILDKLPEDQVPPHEHDWDYVVIVEPTCVNEGTAELHCKKCDAVVEMVLPIDPTNHDWDNWIVTSNPTCYKVGVQERYCKRGCGDKQQDYVPTLDPVWVETVEYINNHLVVKVNVKCALCNSKEGSDNSIPSQKITPHPAHWFYAEAQNHTWTIDLDKILAPTCEIDGQVFFICSDCVAAEEEGEGGTDGSGTNPSDGNNPAEGGEGSGESSSGSDSHKLPSEKPEDVDVQKAYTRDPKTGALDWTVVETIKASELDEQTLIDNYQALADSLSYPIPTPGHLWGEWILRHDVHEQENEFGYWIRRCERSEVKDTFTFTDYLVTGETVTVPVTDANEDGYTMVDENDVIPCISVYGVPLTQEYVGAHAPVGSCEECDYELIDEQEPDCVNDGYKTYRCKVCYDQYTEVIDALGHVETVFVEAVEPTCTEPGSTADIRCSECGLKLVKPVEIPALGHDWDELADIEPTCGDDGLSGAKTCKRCGEEIEGTVIPATGAHKYEFQPKVEPTCTEEGHEAGMVCSVCGQAAATGDTIPALGHTPETIPAVAPTCTATGLTEGVKCSVCDEILTAPETVPAAGHDWEEQVVEAATCQKEGKVLRTCKVCGALETVATEKTAHTWGEWEITTEATKEADGEKTRTCSVCGETETETYAWEPADAPKYTLVDVTYDGTTVRGRLVHDDNTKVADLLNIRVTFFTAGNYYMATAAVIYEDGTFEAEGVGVIEHISLVATGDARIVNPEGLTLVFGTYGFDVN